MFASENTCWESSAILGSGLSSFEAFPSTPLKVVPDARDLPLVPLAREPHIELAPLAGRRQPGIGLGPKARNHIDGCESLIAMDVDPEGTQEVVTGCTRENQLGRTGQEGAAHLYFITAGELREVDVHRVGEHSAWATQSGVSRLRANLSIVWVISRSSHSVCIFCAFMSPVISRKPSRPAPARTGRVW